MDIGLANDAKFKVTATIGDLCFTVIDKKKERRDDGEFNDFKYMAQKGAKYEWHHIGKMPLVDYVRPVRLEITVFL